MTTSLKITGDIAHGVIVADPELRFLDLEDPNKPQWRPVGPVGPAGVVAGICGSAVHGVAAYVGNVVSYLTMIGNPLAKWRQLPMLPYSAGGIGGLAGDPARGLTVVGDDGRGVRRLFSLTMGDAAPAWTEKASPSFSVRLFAGGTDAGSLALGCNGDSWLFSIRGPGADAAWKPAVALPIAVDLVCGDALGGYVIHGEGQLLGIDAQGTVKMLSRPEFIITAMTGDLTSGVVVAVNAAIIACCADLAKGTWTIGASLAQAGPAQA